MDKRLKCFLKKRGFDINGSLLSFLGRMLVKPFFVRHFCEFWRLWNPFYAFFLHNLYLRLGGENRPFVNQLIVFICSGFLLHDLGVSLLMGTLSLNTTLVFIYLFFVTFLSRVLAKRKNITEENDNNVFRFLYLLKNIIIIFLCVYLGTSTNSYIFKN